MPASEDRGDGAPSTRARGPWRRGCWCGGARRCRGRAQLGAHGFDDEEARVRLRVIGGDVRRQLDQAVARGRLKRGDGGDGGILRFGDVARGHAGVDGRHCARGGQRRQELAALLEHDGVRPSTRRKACGRRARHAEEAVIHAHHDLAHGLEIVLGEEIVALAKGARDRVLERQDPSARAPRGDAPRRRRGTSAARPSPPSRRAPRSARAGFRSGMRPQPPDTLR